MDLRSSCRGGSEYGWSVDVIGVRCDYMIRLQKLVRVTVFSTWVIFAWSKLFLYLFTKQPQHRSISQLRTVRSLSRTYDFGRSGREPLDLAVLDQELGEVLLIR